MSPALLVPFNVLSDQGERGTDKSIQTAHAWIHSQEKLVSVLPLAKASLDCIQNRVQLWFLEYFALFPFPEHCFAWMEFGRASALRVRMGDTLPR